MVWTLQAELDRHIAGCEIDDAPRNEKRRHTPGPLVRKHQRGFGDALDPADAGADHHAARDLILVRRGVPPRMLQGLARRAHGIDDKVVDPALLLWLHPLIGVVGAVGAVATRNLARDLGCQILNFEFLNPARAALAGEQSLPRGLHATSERRNHSKSRDDNAPHPGSLNFYTSQIRRGDLRSALRVRDVLKGRLW